LSEIIEEIGVSKQAAGQLVDTLVMRGYLERTVDTEDRRRLNVSLTERGRAAVAAQTAGRARVDAALLERVGAEHLSNARNTLAALIGIGREDRAA
jgi:DNA-binding MarR family transcriptional regulator